MDFLRELWLPILLSAAAIWIVSIIASMALPHHKGDFVAIPDPPGEDAFMDDLRRRAIKPGNYVFPDFRGREALNSPKVRKALNEGPVGHLSVWPTPLTMGGKMVATFLVHLAASALIAYLARLAMPGPADFGAVLRFAAAAGALAYCFAHLPSAIWWGSYKRTMIANVVDGLVYGAIIGLIFAWQWPR